MVYFIGTCHASTSNSLSYEYYDIEVDKVSKLYNFVKKAGPKVGERNAWATLDWDLNTEYELRSVKGGCRFIAKDVYVVGKVTLPKWTKSKDLTDSDKKWWSEFSQFILDHEKNHYNNTLIGAEEIVSEIKNIPVTESCKKAREEYLSIKHKALNKIHKLDLQLDKQTRRKFAGNDKLFARLKNGQTLVVQSSFMRGYLGL